MIENNLQVLCTSKIVLLLHCGSYVYLNLLPEELFSVVESSEILVLSQQLNGRLRAVGIQFGHVQIVHKYGHFLACWSTCIRNVVYTELIHSLCIKMGIKANLSEYHQWCE